MLFVLGVLRRHFSPHLALNVVKLKFRHHYAVYENKAFLWSKYFIMDLKEFNWLNWKLNNSHEHLTPAVSDHRFQNKEYQTSSVERLVLRPCSPKTLMMPKESIEGESVFLVLLILFPMHTLQVKKKQRISCICWERCVLSVLFPNCLDKLITQHIIYFFIPVWKSWVWSFKETPLEVASVFVVGNIYIYEGWKYSQPCLPLFLVWSDGVFSLFLNQVSEGEHGCPI